MYQLSSYLINNMLSILPILDNPIQRYRDNFIAKMPNLKSEVSTKKARAYTLGAIYVRVVQFTFIRILLNPATSSTQLHPPPLSSFQSLLSSLQHLQQYLNQNIARNWAISPNLGQKIKSCPF